MIIYADFELRKSLIEKVLKSLERHNVSLFVLAIVLSILLKADVSEMHLVILVVQAVLLTCCS